MCVATAILISTLDMDLLFSQIFPSFNKYTIYFDNKRKRLQICPAMNVLEKIPKTKKKAGPK